MESITQPNDMIEHYTKFIKDQLETNPNDIDNIVENLSNDPKIKNILEIIVNIEKINLIKNKENAPEPP
jgi:hypothetical protein